MMRTLHHRVVRWMSLIIAVEAVLVMTGWVFGLEPLTRIAPVGVNMRFITAFLFLLSAFGLYFISRAVQDEDELALAVLPGISLAIFIVTITLLASRLLDTPTGVEDLFLRHSDPIDYSGLLSVQGWPAMSTLLNFILFGLAGIAALFPGLVRNRFLAFSGYFIGLLGATALLGYALNLPVLYFAIGPAIPMALNTAVLFVLLGFGLVWIRKFEKMQ